MKTMMDLLVRLQEVEDCARIVLRNNQLTPLAKRSALGYVALVREIIPAEVQTLYDQMKQTAPDLLDSRELFAMAVLVATYRTLSPRKRTKLLNYFVPDPRPAGASIGHQQGRLACVGKRPQGAARRSQAAHNRAAHD
jgi:hypothetical protein